MSIDLLRMYWEKTVDRPVELKGKREIEAVSDSDLPFYLFRMGAVN